LTDGGDESGTTDDVDEEEASDDEAPLNQLELSPEAISAVRIGKISNGTVHVSEAPKSREWKQPYSKELIIRTASLLGKDAAKEVILLMN